MCTFLVGILLFSSPSAQSDAERVYEGTWVTTNRRLDGTMTCVVTDLGDNQWRGHFSGVWQGVHFTYKVDFNGPPDNLRGRAVIDGADYEWTGEMGKDFKATFTGNRYLGSFRLKQKHK